MGLFNKLFGKRQKKGSKQSKKSGKQPRKKRRTLKRKKRSKLAKRKSKKLARKISSDEETQEIDPTINDQTEHEVDPSIHDEGEKEPKKKIGTKSAEAIIPNENAIHSEHNSSRSPSHTTVNSTESPSNQNGVATTESVKKRAGSQNSHKLKQKDTEEAHLEEVKTVSGPTAPGLEFLKDTAALYVFKKKDPLGFIVDSILISSYNVLNDKGDPIYYIGETQEQCFLCSTWSNRLPIYTIQGELIMSILRRNPSCCSPSTDEQMEQFMNMDTEVYSEEEKHPPKPAYHLSLSTGEFLGHIKAFGSDFDEKGKPFKYILMDTKFKELYKIKVVKPAERAGSQSDVSNHVNEDADSHFDIYFKRKKLGKINARVNVKRFGIATKSARCFQASFPSSLTDVQKALILGLIAVAKCQTIFPDEDACKTCCVLFCKSTCTIC